LLAAGTDILPHPWSFYGEAPLPAAVSGGRHDGRAGGCSERADAGRLGDRRFAQRPVQLVPCKGFGHPLNKPKANRGAMQQNFDWFTKYLWTSPGVTQ
jgi:hypothetical protein